MCVWGGGGERNLYEQNNNCVLNGSEVLSYEENCVLFSIVQQFILNTCRFAASAFDV